jgi:hypothetical protein
MPADETRWRARLIDDGPDEKLIFFVRGAASTGGPAADVSECHRSHYGKGGQKDGRT